MADIPPPIDPIVQAILDTIIKNLRIELAGPSTMQPGQVVSASLSSFPDVISTIKLINAPLNISGRLDPATINGHIDPVTRVSKKVQYEERGLEPNLADFEGRIKTEATPVILPGGFTTVPGYSGLLEQFAKLVGSVVLPTFNGLLNGAVTIPLPVQVPVMTRVTWDVLDAAGNVLTPGLDFLAPAGIHTLSPRFTLRPPIATDPTDNTPLEYSLRATVQLIADTYKTERIPLELLKLHVLPLPLPLSTLFRLSLNDLPRPGLPTNISLLPPTDQIPNIPDIFALTWEKTNLHPTKLPVPLEARWEIFRIEGTEEKKINDEHVQILGDLKKPLLSMLIQPNIVELNTDHSPISVLPPETIHVRASVRLARKSQPDDVGWIKLPTLPVPVPTIAIPTVLALFNHRDFSLNTYGGIPPCALVVVPTNSLLSTANPEALINTLRDLLGIVNQLSKAPTRLPLVNKLMGALGPLEKLVNTLAALSSIATPGDGKGPKLVMRVTNEEGKLDDILFFKHHIGDIISATADDSFGSLILIGPPGKSLRFYINQHFDHEGTDKYDTAGAFNLRLPKEELASFAALIDSLHGDPPATYPGEAFIPHRGASENSFGDRISSFKFLPDDWLSIKITDFTPKSGSPGTLVAVDLQNGHLERLELNGKAVEFNWVDLFKVHITIPAGATSGKLKARFRDLEGESSEPFTVLPSDR